MQQFQQIQNGGNNDAQLFQYWQQSEFQKWKRGLYGQPEEAKGNNVAKVFFIMMLLGVVGLLAFLFFKSRKKTENITAIKKTDSADSVEQLETSNKPKLNGKKFLKFSKLEQHREFRDAGLEQLSKKQTIPEFQHWLLEMGFECDSDSHYYNSVGDEVIFEPQGIEIFPTGNKQKPIYRSFAEVEELSFREDLLKLLKL